MSFLLAFQADEQMINAALLLVENVCLQGSAVDEQQPGCAAR
jgi:hypothetical protein